MTAVVDDDPVHLDLISSKLRNIGINNLSIFTDTHALLSAVEERQFDLLLCDYYLGAHITFADLYDQSVYLAHIPTVLISSFYDQSLLDQILKIRPFQFIAKNASSFEIKKTITLALSYDIRSDASAPLFSSIFVKSGSRLKKIVLKDIWHIRVSNNYLELLYADRSKAAIRSTLIEFLKKLPNNFIKANQSEVINIDYIKEIDLKDDMIILQNDYKVALSRNFRRIIIDRFRFK